MRRQVDWTLDVVELQKEDILLVATSHEVGGGP